MELQDNYQAFRALDAEIVAVAQEESDAATLMRAERFVKSTFPFVADPDKKTWDVLSRYGVYLVDKSGDIRVKLEGTKAARPRLDVILEELAWMAGGGAGLPDDADGKDRAQGDDTVRESATDREDEGQAAAEVVEARWMWSHDRVRPGDTFKLAFCPTIAQGHHVYAPWEEQMSPFSVTLEVPTGVRLVTPMAYPAAARIHDPVMDMTLATYADEIPLSTLVFEAAEDLVPGELSFRATISYQACNETVCYPPKTQVVEMKLEAGSAESKRQQVYGWNSW